MSTENPNDIVKQTLIENATGIELPLATAEPSGEAGSTPSTPSTQSTQSTQSTPESEAQ